MIFSGFLLGVTCGLIFYLTQEKVYRCEARLSYQLEHTIPSEISPDNQNGLGDMISQLTQSVLSPKSLETIISEEDLYTHLQKEMTIEEVVGIMHEDISIAQVPEADTILIEYEGSDPAKVVRVTDALAAEFADAHQRYQEKQASETLAYIKYELNKTNDMLIEKEAFMNDYKMKYYYEMPDQQSRNQSQLSSLKQKYKTIEETIKDIERTKLSILDLIEVKRKILVENQTQASSQQEGEEKQTEYSNEAERLRSIDEDLVALATQLDDKNQKIKILEKKQEETSALIYKYEGWVSSALIRETEWLSLADEYNELKEYHESLTAQNLEASAVLNPVANKKINRFKIEIPARMPEAPIKPNMIAIVILSAITGLLISVSLAIYSDAFDTTLKSKVEVEQSFDLPVICTLPNLPLAGETNKLRYLSVLRAGVFMIWFSTLFIALVILGRDGEIITPIMQFLR